MSSRAFQPVDVRGDEDADEAAQGVSRLSGFSALTAGLIIVALVMLTIAFLALTSGTLAPVPAAP